MVVAVLALFIAMAGTGYAAIKLPANSVATAQLRDDAVTRSKLADHSVSTAQLAHNSATRNRLSAGVRTARQGRSARTRATGPAGPKGADGAGAGRIQTDAAATANPVATILDMAGLTIQAACIQNGADVNVGLRINPSETAVLQANFTLDSGIDPTTVGPAQTGNVQIALTANTDNDACGRRPGRQQDADVRGLGLPASAPGTRVGGASGLPRARRRPFAPRTWAGADHRGELSPSR